MLQGRIVEKDAFYVTAVVWTGPYEDAKEIPVLWRSFVERAEAIEGQVNPGTYVSPCNDRETDFTCYIGVEVAEGSPAPVGMRHLKVPAHKYAMFTHEGPMSKVQDTYMAAFKWLADHGCEKEKNSFTLEVYDNRYCPATDSPDGETNAYDIYIPIR